MDFGWSTEQQAYRSEIREIISRNLPEDWWQSYANDGPSNPRLMQFARGFAKVLAAQGHVVSHWPSAYGGRDSDPWEHIILSEEMWSEGEPRSSLYMGSNWAGPAILMFGTEEQKQLHLSNIAQGNVLWCQGFSEPEAGSDLASLRTRATRVSDGYAITGRKIWTSYAHSADWIFLLARTEGQGHAGVTCFLIPVHTPGISIRGIKGVQSADELHETTFEDMRVPLSARLGQEGKGWEIVNAALHNERVGQAHYEFARRGLDQAVRLLAESGRFDSPTVRAEAASCLAITEAARLLVYKVIDQRVRNEPPTAFTSVARIAMVQATNAVANFIATYLPEALTEGGDGRLQLVFKYAMVTGIGGGAAEIQLNLVATRYLGLPRGG